MTWYINSTFCTIYCWEIIVTQLDASDIKNKEGKSFNFDEFMHFAVHSIVNNKIIIKSISSWQEAKVQLYYFFSFMTKTLVPNSQLYIHNHGNQSTLDILVHVENDLLLHCFLLLCSSRCSSTALLHVPQDFMAEPHQQSVELNYTH